MRYFLVIEPLVIFCQELCFLINRNNSLSLCFRRAGRSTFARWLFLPFLVRLWKNFCAHTPVDHETVFFDQKYHFPTFNYVFPLPCNSIRGPCKYYFLKLVQINCPVPLRSFITSDNFHITNGNDFFGLFFVRCVVNLHDVRGDGHIVSHSLNMPGKNYFLPSIFRSHSVRGNLNGRTVSLFARFFVTRLLGINI